MLIALGLTSALTLKAQDADATVYRYVDENGVVHLSNVPNDPAPSP